MLGGEIHSALGYKIRVLASPWRSKGRNWSLVLAPFSSRNWLQLKLKRPGSGDTQEWARQVCDLLGAVLERPTSFLLWVFLLCLLYNSDKTLTLLIPKYIEIFPPHQAVFCDTSWVSYNFLVIQSLSCVQLFATPWIAAQQASLSITNSWLEKSLLKLIPIESVMPPSHLILCHPLLLLLSVFPSISVFSGGSALCILLFNLVLTLSACK